MNLDHFKNEDGTFNGAAMTATLTDIDHEEILWTFGRLRELLDAGHSKSEAKAIVTEEAKQKPWA